MCFQPTQRHVQIQSEESILEVALKAHININHSCGGMGTCGTCRVLILNGNELLEPRNELEAEMADERGFSTYERLACQTAPVAGIEVEILSKK